MQNNKNNRSSLDARFYAVADINVHDIRQMYGVYSQYYENTSWEIFLSDFSKKTGAFLIRRKTDGHVVGFSTVMNCDVKVGEKKVRAIFSGDTVIERAYWGTRCLQSAFYQYVIAEKFRNPQRPLYWLLISKGYKTYLLLANNFYHFYPRQDHHEQHLEDIVRAYCEQMFPGYFDATRGILDFGSDYQPLRGDVAEITPKMMEDNPKIRFFEECNPEWRRGTELPCIGEITWSCLAKFVGRYASKPVSKGALEVSGRRGRRRPTGLVATFRRQASKAIAKASS